MGRLTRRELLLACGTAPFLGCSSEPDRRDQGSKTPQIVLKHQPFWGDPAPFRDLLATFEKETGVTVATEPLPNSSDVVHQFFLTALEGGASDFDVFVVDVVWVAEFARAGWIADLSASISPEVLRRDFLAGAADAAIVQGHTWAVPFYVDAGLLYRRVDLVPSAPTTYEELGRTALEARRSGAVDSGFVWQGRQYEGLVCNVYEAIWGHGGAAMQNGRVLLDTQEARAALEYLRGLLVRGVSPPSVTSQAEEEARRVFQDGRAAFMRNWPYAFAEAQRPGSKVAGKVAISPLPTLSGAPGNGALGGYLLALNAAVPPERREAATRLITHLTSLEANLVLALAYSRNPARQAAYTSPRLLREAPTIAALLPVVENAKPRPVTPYYPMISDVLQSEFSAALAGIRSPGEALHRAQALVDHLTGARHEK